MKKVQIATPQIVAPNMIGTVEKETGTTVTVMVSEMVFEPKSSKTLTYEFDEDRRRYFSEVYLGQVMTFHKATGRRVSGGKYSPYLLDLTEVQ